MTNLQSSQNAAARLITRTRKFDSNTPVIRDLHLVGRRIEFNIATLVYKCLNGFGQPPLADEAFSSQQCLDDGTRGLPTLATWVFR